MVFLSRTEEAAAEVKTLLAKEGAADFSVRAPLRTRLAFPIKKNDAAHLGVIQFTLEKNRLGDISRLLRLNANLLRFEMVKVIERDEATAPLAEENRGEANREATEPASDRRDAPRSERRYTELSNEALEKKLEEMLR